MLAQQEEMALKKEQEAEAIAKRTAMIEEARQMKVRRRQRRDEDENDCGEKKF